MVAERCDAGLITDGDADRIGAVDEHGNVVDAHKILSLLMYWLLERKKWPGEVTRAFNTTKMVDRIAAKYGRKLNEHGIGFKYVVDLMLEKEILIGGEESGGIGISRHLPERDGLLNCLLLANVMADEKKTSGRVGCRPAGGVWRASSMAESICILTEEVKQSAIARAKAGVAAIAGMKVLRVETLDGIKFFLDNPDCAGKKNAAETWLLLRASGTEPLLRVYCESCSAGVGGEGAGGGAGVCARWRQIVSVTVETGAPRRIAGAMARVSNSAPEKLEALWRRFHEEKIVE